MRFAGLLVFSLLIFNVFQAEAQFLRAKVGTDIPMQYLVGLNYQQGKMFSFDASAGYIGTPYNGDLYRVISVPEKHQARKEFLMETTDDGWVFGGGANVNFGKWYAGVFGQHITLNASGTYEYLLGSDLYREELSEDDKAVIDLFLASEYADGNLNQFGIDVDLQDEVTVRTNIFQAGLKIGRRFFLKNNRWEFRTELAFSKNFYSKTESDYDEDLINTAKARYNQLKLLEANNPELFEALEESLGFEIPLDANLDKNLDFESKEDEVDEFFSDYGYIPTLNIHVTYLLWVPKKVKQLQQKIDEDKANN